MATVEKLHFQISKLKRITLGTFTDKLYSCLQPIDLVYDNPRSYRAIYELKADKHFLNTYGFIHSGAFATIIDVTVVGAFRCSNKYTSKIVTAHLEMDLLKEVRDQEKLRIQAIIYETGKYLNFGNVLLMNEKQELVAKGSAVGSCVYTKEEEEKLKTIEPDV